jgi:hypothetical protein
MMLSWNTFTDESNITVRDVTVIHVEHEHDFPNLKGNPAVFGAMHGGKGNLKDIWFENIVIEGPVFRGKLLMYFPHGAVFVAIVCSCSNTHVSTPNLHRAGFGITVQHNKFATSSLGTISNLTFKRVHFLDEQPIAHPNELFGTPTDTEVSPASFTHGSSHTGSPEPLVGVPVPPGYIGDVIFDGLWIHGAHVMNSSAAVLDVKNGTVESCSFV